MSQSGTVEASYRPYIHRGALSELGSIPEHNAAELKEITRKASRLEQPSSHSGIKQLKASNGLLRVRSGKYRAVADIQLDKMRILLVDHREVCYSKISVAKERASDQ